MMYRVFISFFVFTSAYLFVRYGGDLTRRFYQRQIRAFDRALRQQLLTDIDPRTAFWASVSGVGVAAIAGYLVTGSLWASLILAGVSAFIPILIIRHLESKRLTQLNRQLVDGLVTLASGVRAGLTLVQSMEMLVENYTGPIQQEFSQLLREYQMGMDLNQAMRSASDRIGSPLYRLTFTAIEMHRIRGGDAGESLDRIADSIREIERLEGKLEALTSQSRTQAWMMSAMPIVFIVMLGAIDPQGMGLVWTEPLGRLLLLVVGLLIGAAFLWIRKIMTIDI